MSRVHTVIITALFTLISMLPLAGKCQDYAGYDTSLPVEITADQLDILQKNKLAVFRGNVVAQQGTIKLRADTMTVHYRQPTEREDGAAAVSKIEVMGNVFMATPQESAQAKKGMYDLDEKMIYLLGNVVLTRGKNVLKGERLQYNLKTGRSVIIGNSGSKPAAGDKGSRVRGIFVPQDAKQGSK